MLWDLHGFTLQAEWNDSELGERWQAAWASRPISGAPPDFLINLNIVDTPPPAPAGSPQFRQTDLIEYYFSGESLTAHFPRYGQLRFELTTGQTVGEITRAALKTYGVFEDLLAIGLSPHLRRRGLFLIHAFAATPPPAQTGVEPGRGRKGILLVGHIGSGKTTTGLALLNAGWGLLSNDSPIISHSGEIRSYPGLLAAYPNTLQRFAATRSIAADADTSHKIVLAAESIWPDVWAECAQPSAILFPQIEPRADHALERLSQPEALRSILPHAIEQWDQALIPGHLALLNQLIQSAPAYRLRLGPDTDSLPTVLASVI